MTSAPKTASRSDAPHLKTLLWSLIAALAWGSFPAKAEIHVIDTFGPRWRPQILYIAPGDIVVWRGMRSHDTRSVDGLAPDGARGWRSALNEDGFSVTLQAEGVYIYSCQTHAQAGMLGAIVVGDGSKVDLGLLESRAAAIVAGRAFAVALVRRLRAELADR